MNRQMNGLALRIWQSVCVDRRGVDTDENLVVLRDRPLDLLDSQHVRAPVPVVDYSSHAVTPIIVRTTFPVFCPVSTYLVASTTSSKG